MAEALHTRSLSSVLADICRGALRSRMLTDALLERIAEREPHSRAFVQVLSKSARAEADAADAALQAGKPPGLLHGVPIAIKDLLQTRGVPTSCGTTVLADWRPAADATVVARLRAAGAVIIGKVKLTEGAYSHHHPDVLAPINPRRADLWTGVSSSGSGVAVADQLCFGAIGSDTGGSIRFPSACCGVVGLKPTYGRVSRFGAFPLAESLDHVGPMARCVEDVARIYMAIAGFDALDATSLNVPVPAPPLLGPRDEVGATAAYAKGLRVGFDAGFASEGVASEVVAVVDDAVQRLRAAGAEIVPVQVPPWRALVQGWVMTTAVEVALAHQPTFPAERRRYGPHLSSLLDLGTRVTGQDYAVLERARERFRADLQAMFKRHELAVLLCPAMPVPTPLTSALDARPGTADGVAPMITFTAPFNYSGHPSLTLPAGQDADGRPIAIQLIAALQEEATLFGAGMCWEHARQG